MVSGESTVDEVVEEEEEVDDDEVDEDDGGSERCVRNTLSIAAESARL